MIRYLALAALASGLLGAPAVAFAQADDNSTSTYSDAMPKKPKPHRSAAHRHHKTAHRKAAPAAGSTAQ
jgi:hypothetical protein